MRDKLNVIWTLIGIVVIVGGFFAYLETHYAHASSIAAQFEALQKQTDKINDKVDLGASILERDYLQRQIDDLKKKWEGKKMTDEAKELLKGYEERLKQKQEEISDLKAKMKQK